MIIIKIIILYYIIQIRHTQIDTDDFLSTGTRLRNLYLQRVPTRSLSSYSIYKSAATTFRSCHGKFSACDLVEIIIL